MTTQAGYDSILQNLKSYPDFDILTLSREISLKSGSGECIKRKRTNQVICPFLVAERGLEPLTSGL